VFVRPRFILLAYFIGLIVISNLESVYKVISKPIMENDKSKIGWNFKNTYVNLPDIILTRISPVPVKEPSIVIFNEELSKELGLDFTSLNKNSIAELFCGNVLPEGSDPIAQAYAGHQFGQFTILGDGRAIVLGEHVKPNNNKVDIQYKGSGQTPYSRGADGRAALGPMLREYVMSEAMHALGIPTTRSLSVVKTGEYIFRENPLPGAILTRIASSHIRVGTFQYLASRGDVAALRDLVKYSINRHYPNLNNEENLSIALLNVVMAKQIDLIVNWMRVGFIHGVMNTDNMTISGETIDYGPCAFMDQYDEKTCFSSIDFQGRYSYGNQPSIAQWNLARFAETLLPLIHEDQDKAVNLASEIINNFKEIYEKKWLKMMRSKLGLFDEEKQDVTLIRGLLTWMQTNKVDFTNTFCHLMNKDFKNNIYQNNDFKNWHKEWEKRLEKSKRTEEEVINLMQTVNPVVIPRNYKMEEALQQVETKDDMYKITVFLKFLQKPYMLQEGINIYQLPPGPGHEEYKTFCGT
jgi:uncharacterized protein YdiU (UPF0061 family)